MGAKTVQIASPQTSNWPPKVGADGLTPYTQEMRLSYAKPGPYVTPLTPEEEQQFKGWVKQNKVPFEDDGPQTGYDLRGFWRAAQHGDPEAQSGMNPYDHRIHYSDKWKTPYSEEGFSNQSIYAKPEAPSWQGNDALGWKLVDNQGRVFKHQPGVPLPENVPPPAGPPPLEMKPMSIMDLYNR